jgi:2-polyprenyl-3-methyl-5-hydroxy-6-metoxy-1,4-benzoquinol methylase
MNQRDLWNERYRERGALWGAEPNQFVEQRLSGLEPRRVLDMGSGQGRNAIWLAHQGHEVTAVDVSDVAAEQGREIATKVGVAVAFVTADLQEWEPDPGAFDLVLLAYMQAPAPLRQALHAKAARALAPGGTVFIIAHHRDNLEHGIGGPPVLEVLFDEKSVADDFRGFEVVENSRIVRRVDRDDIVGDAIDLLFVGAKPVR